MKFASQLKKAMIDKGVNYNNELAELSGVSYYIVNRLMKDDNSCRLKDLVEVATFLGVKISLDGVIAND